MTTQFNLVQEITSLNFSYERKYNEENIFSAIRHARDLFDYENYLSPLISKIAPHLYARLKAEDEMEPYYKLVKPNFLSELKKEVSRLGEEEKNFEINLKRDLVVQINFLLEDLSRYNKKTEIDKNHQKITIEDFFQRNKPNFLIILRANEELGLSMVKDSKIIHLQFLFFSHFSEIFKKYIYSLSKNTELTRVVKTYFYYSPLDLKKYYETNDLLTLDPHLGSIKNSKINIRLMKHFLDEKTYNIIKSIALK